MTSVVEAINHAAGTWWTFAAHATWQSSLLAAIVLVAVRLGRRWPAQLRYALVLIALMKFAVPPTLSLPTGLFSHLGPVVVLDADRPAAEKPDGADDRPADDATVWAAVTHALGTASWQSWLMLLHVAGCLAAAACLAAQWASVLAMARRARAFARGPLCEHLADLCRQMHLRRPVRLLISAEPVSPMAFGVLRPSVLVPASLFRDVPPRQMDTILAHELAHHRRGDILVNWCQAALTTLWWFNPLIWVLNRAVRSAREDCCDDLLLTRKLTTDGAYCQALLKVATGLRRSRLAAAVSGFAQRVHPLGDRMRRIMDPRLHRAEKLSFVTLGVVLAIAGLVLPGLRSGTPAARRAAGGGRRGWRGRGTYGLAAAGARPTPRLPRPERIGPYLWYVHGPDPSVTGRDPTGLAETPDASDWPPGERRYGGPYDSTRPDGPPVDVYRDMDPAGPDAPTATVFILDMDILREVGPAAEPPGDVRPFKLPPEPPPPQLDWETPQMRFAQGDGGPAGRDMGFAAIIELAEKAAPILVRPKLDPPAGPPAPQGLWKVAADFALLAEDAEPPVCDSSGPIVLRDVPDAADGGQQAPPAYDDYLAKIYEKYPELVGLLDDVPPEAFTSGSELMPEPAGLLLCCVGAAALLRRRGRRR